MSDLMQVQVSVLGRKYDGAYRYHHSRVVVYYDGESLSDGGTYGPIVPGQSKSIAKQVLCSMIMRRRQASGLTLEREDSSQSG